MKRGKPIIPRINTCGKQQLGYGGKLCASSFMLLHRWGLTDTTDILSLVNLLTKKTRTHRAVKGDGECRRQLAVPKQPVGCVSYPFLRSLCSQPPRSMRDSPVSAMMVPLSIFAQKR